MVQAIKVLDLIRFFDSLVNVIVLKFTLVNPDKVMFSEQLYGVQD